MSQSFFITAATGKQGGATVDALLALNKSRSASDQIKVNVLVRDPTSSAAQRLADLGSNVKVFQGDHDNMDALTAAASGCSGVFLNVTPKFEDAQAESRHARNIIAASKAGSVKRLVYSSSSGVARPQEELTNYIEKNPQSPMAAYIKSKQACEKATLDAAQDFLADGSMILRPALFWTNFVLPNSAMIFPQLSATQTITSGLDANKQQSSLDPADIGTFVAKVLVAEDFSQRWAGKVIPFAGVNMTEAEIVDQMNAAIYRLSGGKSSKKVKLDVLSSEDVKARAEAGDPFMGAADFQNKTIQPYDIEKDVTPLVGDVVKWTTCEEFFEKQAKDLETTIGGF